MILKYFKNIFSWKGNTGGGQRPKKKRPVDEIPESSIKITTEHIGKKILYFIRNVLPVPYAGVVVVMGDLQEGVIKNISKDGDYLKINDNWYQANQIKVKEILETRPIRDYVRPKPMINFNYGYQPEDESGNLDRSNPPTGGSGCPSRISHMDKGGTLKKPTTRRPVNPPKGHRSKSHD